MIRPSGLISAGRMAEVPRRPSQIMTTPKASITRPHHKLILIPNEWRAYISLPPVTTPYRASSAPRIANISPIGSLTSKPIRSPCTLPKDHVQCQREQQDDDGEYAGVLIPRQPRVLRLRRERVDQPLQFFIRPRACGERDEDRHQEAGRPGEDRGPKILRHLARISVQDRAE